MPSACVCGGCGGVADEPGTTHARPPGGPICTGRRTAGADRAGRIPDLSFAQPQQATPAAVSSRVSSLS